MDNAISFLNSYLSGGTTDQRGKTSLSVVSGLDKAVSPAVHLHSVASQLICLLKHTLVLDYIAPFSFYSNL